MSPVTKKVIFDYLNLETEKGAYRAALESKDKLNLFYERAKKSLNADSSLEIAFMDSASRAWNMALYGIKLNKGDHIVTLSSEFGTNLLSLFYRAYQVGATVDVIQTDSSGDFDMGLLENSIRKGGEVVAISHAAGQGSIVNPVKEIGDMAKRYGALFLVDGCQALGQIPVDVKSIQADAYTATGRKWLRGPRGTGLLFVNSKSHLKAEQIDLSGADLVFDKESGEVKGVDVRNDARQFELWERSYAGMLGLSNAILENQEQDIEVLNSKVRAFANRIRKEIVSNPKLNLVGKPDSISGLSGFYVNDVRDEDRVRRNFEDEGVEISTFSHWDCPMFFPKNGIKSIFRLSPHYYTPESSIDVACRIISEI